MTENEKAWIKEFYPIPADSKRLKTDVARLKHSLRKWIGLRKESLRKHGLMGPPISVDSDTCALCHKHVRPAFCPTCPLNALRGQRCDHPKLISPYHAWYNRHDPEPMIALLEEALAKELERTKAARK